jgi:hypothetical protein
MSEVIVALKFDSEGTSSRFGVAYRTESFPLWCEHAEPANPDLCL